MSDQGTSQQPSSEERSSSEKQQERDRRTGGTGGSGSSGGSERSRHRRRRPHNPQPPRPETSLNMEELRELMELFTEHGLTEFEFERDEFRIHLGRNLTSQSSSSIHETPTPHASAHDASHARAAAAGASTLGSHAATPPHPGAQAEAAASADEDLHIITSPIVGTFYRSPSPTADPFIRIGSRVEHDTVVCIIEAMKLMNEIQSETSGEVVKIYVENGQPVEYGQPLFGIKK
ncbi:MAG TPA: acetyl-CoA carboxylase biotin carboxyl carrier protein [Pyrinomonadaceae bacterium]|jgi:acetyl-CoA carboxylase biotin carboxyl carrier protein|nr:acetyl-CoA carboxylase biotin carboxyl carrier protein [Pyrinomonadaceae bacterium]